MNYYWYGCKTISTTPLLKGTETDTINSSNSSNALASHLINPSYKGIKRKERILAGIL
ncbi:MAG TPA: hypothetical protein VE818_06415 [Nitrososphaeraceae archaeon]|nr:hypothetical protein [Nitrososphaeraceae archaeon]